MNFLHITILIISLVIYVESKPNQCCSNNKQILKGGGCENNGTLLIKQTCDNFYASFPETNGTKHTLITENDELYVIAQDYTIAKDRYCVGEFANKSIILTCFPEKSGIPNNRLAIIICTIISIICLLITIGVYAILPRLRDLLGKCIMCTISCLLLGFVFITIVQGSSTFSYGACYFTAISIYFWFLGSFSWMNIVAFHIWRSMANPSYPRNPKRVFIYYSIYGWGNPLLNLLIAVIAFHIPGDHVKPTWTVVSCWFSDYESALRYFHIPTALLLASNVVIFILSACELRKQTNNAMDNKLRSKKYKFLLCLKLFLTMGICWIFEPVSFILKYGFFENIWLITDFINSLQGLIIFLLLVVLRKRVRRDLARHKGICCRKLPQDWATIADDDCEELSEDAEKINGENES